MMLPYRVMRGALSGSGVRSGLRSLICIGLARGVASSALFSVVVLSHRGEGASLRLLVCVKGALLLEVLLPFAAAGDPRNRFFTGASRRLLKGEWKSGRRVTVGGDLLSNSRIALSTAFNLFLPFLYSRYLVFHSGTACSSNSLANFIADDRTSLGEGCCDHVHAMFFTKTGNRANGETSFCRVAPRRKFKSYRTMISPTPHV